MTVEEFIEAVIGRGDELDFDESFTKFHIDKLFAATNSAVTPQEFLARLNDEEHPEVVEGLGLYISAYSKGFEGCIGRPEFSLLLRDFCVSAPLQYEIILRSILP